MWVKPVGKGGFGIGRIENICRIGKTSPAMMEVFGLGCGEEGGGDRERSG